MGRPRLSEREPHSSVTLTDIALRLFNEQGYDATTMAGIAAAAGIKKASIYFHVQGGKEELLERGVNRALDALFEALDEVGASPGTALERLHLLVERAVEVEVTHLPEVTLLTRLRGNTAVERAAMERRRTFDEAMRKLVRQAQREGDVRSDLDAVLLTRLLLGMVVSVTEWYRPRGRLGWRDIADCVLVVAFDGITTTRPGPDHPQVPGPRPSGSRRAIRAG